MIVEMKIGPLADRQEIMPVGFFLEQFVRRAFRLERDQDISQHRNELLESRGCAARRDHRAWVAGSAVTRHHVALIIDHPPLG
jgi:hypothetical protein